MLCSWKCKARNFPSHLRCSHAVPFHLRLSKCTWQCAHKYSHPPGGQSPLGSLGSAIFFLYIYMCICCYIFRSQTLIATLLRPVFQTCFGLWYILLQTRGPSRIKCIYFEITWHRYLHAGQPHSSWSHIFFTRTKWKCSRCKIWAETVTLHCDHIAACWDCPTPDSLLKEQRMCDVISGRVCQIIDPSKKWALLTCSFAFYDITIWTAGSMMTGSTTEYL